VTPIGTLKNSFVIIPASRLSHSPLERSPTSSFSSIHDYLSGKFPFLENLTEVITWKVRRSAVPRTGRAKSRWIPPNVLARPVYFLCGLYLGYRFHTGPITIERLFLFEPVRHTKRSAAQQSGKVPRIGFLSGGVSIIRFRRRSAPVIQVHDLGCSNG